MPRLSRPIPFPLALALATIAAVWAAGAVWSFEHQERFATSLGFRHGWLLPATSDGLPVAMALVALAASLDGRPATAARLGTALALAGSAASNGLYAAGRSAGDPTTVVVAVAIPVMAGIAFEILLGEVRKRVLQARGRAAPVPIPALRPIRVVLDPVHELAAWRRHVLEATAPARPADAAGGAPECAAPGAPTGAAVVPARGVAASGGARPGLVVRPRGRARGVRVPRAARVRRYSGSPTGDRTGPGPGGDGLIPVALRVALAVAPNGDPPSQRALGAALRSPEHGAHRLAADRVRGLHAAAVAALWPEQSPNGAGGAR